MSLLHLNTLENVSQLFKDYSKRFTQQWFTLDDIVHKSTWVALRISVSNRHWYVWIHFFLKFMIYKCCQFQDPYSLNLINLVYLFRCVKMLLAPIEISVYVSKQALYFWLRYNVYGVMSVNNHFDCWTLCSESLINIII